MKKIKPTSIDTSTLEEFKTIFKYLAFVTCAAEAPIRQKILDETLARIAKAGDSENIKRWCWWTPAQLSLLEQAENLTRVILIGGNGTGKTSILDGFATKMAKKYPDEHIIFAIYQDETGTRPLLHLSLEAKYEKLKLNNISVMTFNEIEELKDASSENLTLCVDEISMGDVNPEDLLGINAKSLWVVIRSAGSKERNQNEYLREHFSSDWDIVDLSYPLRVSKTISERIQSIQEDEIIHYSIFVNRFNEELQLSPNMPVGPEPLILGKSKGSYHARLQLTFNAVGRDVPALIILEYFNTQAMADEVRQGSLKTWTRYEKHFNMSLMLGVLP